VDLSGRSARKAGIDLTSLPRLGEVGTVAGPMEVRLYETARFRFADVDLGPLPILVSPRGW